MGNLERHEKRFKRLSRALEILKRSSERTREAEQVIKQAIRKADDQIIQERQQTIDFGSEDSKLL